jgi:hypothetical protein
MVAIDDTQYLLASDNGLLKTTKDQLLKHYYKSSIVISLCPMPDSLYLLGFTYPDKLIVWSENSE